MNHPLHIFPKAAASFSEKLGKGCLWVLSWMVMGASSLQAQEITVSNAVISIPEGISISTEGGVHLQTDGAIHNDGVLELKGDWENDGDGLLPGGEGTVVMRGDEQEIGGDQSTEFHVLVLEDGAKHLEADIQVSGMLEVHGAVVFRNAHILRTPQETITIGCTWSMMASRVDMPVRAACAFTWPGTRSQGPGTWLKASACVVTATGGGNSGPARVADADKCHPANPSSAIACVGMSALRLGQALPRPSHQSNMMTIHFCADLDAATCGSTGAQAFAAGNVHTPSAIHHGTGHIAEMQLSGMPEVASRSFFIDSERIYLI